MDSNVKDVISSCLPSQTVAQPNRPEPLQITETPEKPWSELAIDYYGPIPQTGQYLMVLIDKHSKYPEVEIVNSTDAKSCIPKLDKIFATYGMPDKMTSDNGPPFNGNDFARYMNILGIEWNPSTPLWPQGNAQAESFMKPLGKLITTTTVENKFWKQELQRFLLMYRTTPHSTTKIPPCELLFNRTVKGLLPQLPCKKVLNKHKLAKTNIENRKANNKRYQDKRRHVKESDIDVGDIVI